MNIETIIAQKVHNLPITKQTKVLEFVEELENIDVNENENDAKLTRLSLIGMFKSGKTDTSERAEEILSTEIKRRSGWTLKDELVD